MKTHLTLAEEKELIDYRESWLKNALRIDPVNHGEAKEVLTEMYDRAGEAVPRIVILPSPISCVIVLALLRLEPESIVLSSAGSRVSKTDMDALANVPALRVLIDCLRRVISPMGVMAQEQAWLEVRSLTENWASDIPAGTDILEFVGSRGVISVQTVVAAVLEQLRVASYSLETEQFATLSTTLEAKLRTDIMTAWSSVFCWGPWHSWWVAFYDFAHRVGAVYSRDFQERLEFAAKSTKVLGTYLFPFRGICFVADRPSVINLWGEFPEAHLHCADGPAIAFRDGYSVMGSGGGVLERSAELEAAWAMSLVHARAEGAAMMPLNVALRRLIEMPLATRVEPVSRALVIEKLRPLQAFSSITVALHSDVRHRVIRASYGSMEDKGGER